MEECAAERHEEERSSTMLDVVVIVLNEATRKLVSGLPTAQASA